MLLAVCSEAGPMPSAVAATSVDSPADEHVQSHQSTSDETESAVEALEVLTSAMPEARRLEGLPTDADTVNSVVDSLVAEALSHAFAEPTARLHCTDKESIVMPHLLDDAAAVSEQVSLNTATAGQLPHLAHKDSPGIAHPLDDEAAVSKYPSLDTNAAEDCFRNKAAVVSMGSESLEGENVRDAAAPAAARKSTEEVGSAMSETLQQGPQAGRAEGSQRLLMQDVSASQEAGADTSVPGEGASSSEGMIVT